MMHFFLWNALALAALSKFSFSLPINNEPAHSQVTISNAFNTGAGNRDNANIHDGIGNRGTDSYTCYYGGWENFPPSSKWVEFEAMWNYSISAMRSSCGDIGITTEDTEQQIGDIYNAIQQVAINSLVDHRFILATIMQESCGCVHITTSTDQDGGANTGLMQSASGVHYDPSNSRESIMQMVIDGTQGTQSGNSLVQGINMYGNIYEVRTFLFCLCPDQQIPGERASEWLMRCTL